MRILRLGGSSSGSIKGGSILANYDAGGDIDAGAIKP
jgi:hypothetical protein